MTPRARSLPAIFTLSLVVAVFAPTAAAQTQFDDFTTPPFAYDNVQGEWINLETQLIEPILVTSNGESVVVANDADNRLVVFNAALSTIKTEVVLGQGIASLAENPYSDVPEIWVSMRHQSAVMVVDTRTWQVRNVLRPPLPAVGVGGADTPGGIAFAEGKAFVAASSTDAVEVYDAITKTHVATIPLTLTHNQLASEMARPYAVVVDTSADPDQVHVLSQISGNQSMPLFAPAGPVDLVIDLNNFAGFSLPDFDIMTIDGSSHAILSRTTEVGTLLFGMERHPTTGQLIVSNMDSKNGQFIGEGSFAGGEVVENLLTFATAGGSSHTYISTETPTTAANVVMPTDIAVDAVGRVYVAGYASKNIGVFDAAGAALGVIAAGSGPRGLALDPSGKTLYCFNRADNSVWSFDVSSPTSLPSGAIHKAFMHDPTFTGVKIGRKIFLDPSNSGAGTAGCFSCHPDLRKDGLTWDLSKYFENSVGHTYTNLPTWKDQKGPMVTQDLRSLEDVPPYHWRGEQPDLDAFNGAFVDLLKGTELGPRRFELMKEYVFSSVYPPNPQQQMNRNFTQAASDGVVGFSTLNSDGSEQNPRTCLDCHALPTGSDASITDTMMTTPASGLSIKTAQLRGMWTKTFSLSNIDESNPPNFGLASVSVVPVPGTGVFHSGIIDDPDEFVEIFFPGILQSERDDIKEFMREFDSGLAPATMYSERLDVNTLAATQVPYLMDQAENTNCDLVMIGRYRVGSTWNDVSVWYDTTQTTPVFIADDSTIGPFTWAQIQGAVAASAAELLVLGVPYWSGERIALDRDRDGIYNVDELNFSGGPLDPTNPDTDGDGLWDGYDPLPLTFPNPVVPGAPVPSTPTEVFATTNSIKITYTTDVLSLTRIEYGTTTAYGQFEGDPFPQIPGDETNHWKRKHTAFLRLLEDGKPYHFRIHTIGQNGQTAVTPDMTTAMFLADHFDNVRVDSMSLAGVRTGADVAYTADVTVVDNQGNLIPNAQVTARLTTYNGLNIGTQTTLQATTNAGGVAQLAFAAVTHAAGDTVVFDVPMTIDFGGSSVAGVVDPTGTAFAWPEGPSMITDVAP